MTSLTFNSIGVEFEIIELGDRRVRIIVRSPAHSSQERLKIFKNVEIIAENMGLPGICGPDIPLNLGEIVEKYNNTAKDIACALNPDWK